MSSHRSLQLLTQAIRQCTLHPQRLGPSTQPGQPLRQCARHTPTLLNRCALNSQPLRSSHHPSPSLLVKTQLSAAAASSQLHSRVDPHTSSTSAPNRSPSLSCTAASLQLTFEHLEISSPVAPSTSSPLPNRSPRQVFQTGLFQAANNVTRGDRPLGLVSVGLVLARQGLPVASSGGGLSCSGGGLALAQGLNGPVDRWATWSQGLNGPMGRRGFASSGKTKVKPYSSMKRRFKLLANGEYKRWRSGKRHNASTKTKKQRRQLRRPSIVPHGLKQPMKYLGFHGKM